MCAASYQLQLFGEDPEAYFDQFFDDDRHRIVLRPTGLANLMRLEDGRKVMRSLSWGLVPHWAKAKKIGYTTFNARAETLSDKSAFRESFKGRRCVLVWDSYVEWREEEGKKIPYKFGLLERGPMFFAGLWASWGTGADLFESCTLITCEPNSLAAQYHNRMPVILERQDIDFWLDPASKPVDLQALLMPFEAELLAVEAANPQDFKRQAA